MDFIEKRLLDCAVHAPILYIPDNPSDHILWPSFPFTHNNLNEKLIDPLDIGFLMNSKDYTPQYNSDNVKLTKNHFNKINKNVKRSLRSGFLSDYEGFVLTRHIYPSGEERYGLLVLLDLEQYSNQPLSIISYAKDFDEDKAKRHSEFLNHSVIDFPFSQAFIEDKSFSLIEPLISCTFNFKLIFSFDHPIYGVYEGYQISTPQHYTLISNALMKIKEKVIIENKPMFIISDGIESFESAKIHWEWLKNKYGNDLYSLHPSRFQMVELLNISNNSTIINPFYIIFKNTQIDDLVKQIRNNTKIKVESQISLKELNNAINKRFDKYKSVCYGMTDIESLYLITFRNPDSDIGIINILDVINEYLVKRNNDICFYSNANEFYDNISQSQDCGIILPPINKDTFFENISSLGKLSTYAYVSDIESSKNFIFEARKIIDD